MSTDAGLSCSCSPASRFLLLFKQFRLAIIVTFEMSKQAPVRSMARHFCSCPHGVFLLGKEDRRKCKGEKDLRVTWHQSSLPLALNPSPKILLCVQHHTLAVCFIAVNKAQAFLTSENPLLQKKAMRATSIAGDCSFCRCQKKAVCVGV